MSSKIVIKIDRLALGGYGVGNIDGKICFVFGALPTEEVEVKITKEKPNCVFAKLIKVLRSSQHRIKPQCPLAIQPKSEKLREHLTCPSCSYQHLEYSEELKIKETQFKDSLKNISNLENYTLLPVIGSPNEYGYRNKMTLHPELDGNIITLGYFMENNSTIIDIPECPLVNPNINKLLKEKRDNKGFFHTLKNRKMSITFRYTENDGVSFWRNKANIKDSWLKEETILGDISVPKDSFFQINTKVADILLEKVQGIIKKVKPNIVIDMFCGVGIFSIVAGKEGVNKVIGLDIDEKAISVAKYNAKNNNLTNCEFHECNAKKINKNIFEVLENTKNNMLILDPPRTGLTTPLLECIINSEVKTIVYISCASDTFARDLEKLITSGYKLQTAQVLDMFPQTAHFESINLLTL